MLNVNFERNECQLLPAEKVEVGGQVSYEQSARIKDITGKLMLSNRVSQSSHIIPRALHRSNTLKLHKLYSLVNL